MTELVWVSISINGELRSRSIPARSSLADFLRNDEGQTGTKLGCEQGVCGSCTVLLDGATTRSCITLAAQASGHRVDTIEGVQDDPVAERLRQAFLNHHSFQCAFCAPGFFLSSLDLISNHTGNALTEEDVRAALSGNLCRCTGYQAIVAAVLEAANSVESPLSTLEGRSDV